ncbi:OsmC family protein [Halobacteriales archaeon Cl-PHB]
MAEIELTSECEEGYAVTTIGDDWELTVDATGETGPTAQQVLAADYASCFIPAFRVGAAKEGFDDVGRIEVEVAAELDEGDDIEWIEFEVLVEESLGDAAEDVVARAEDICHVHDALRDELHAEIGVEEEAF